MLVSRFVGFERITGIGVCFCSDFLVSRFFMMMSSRDMFIMSMADSNELDTKRGGEVFDGNEVEPFIYHLITNNLHRCNFEGSFHRRVKATNTSITLSWISSDP